MKDFKTKRINNRVNVNLENGEIKSMYNALPISQDAFINLYSIYMASIGVLGYLAKSELSVLTVCWKESNPVNDTAYNYNKINNDTSFKESVRKSAPTLDNKTINNIMASLVKKGYLIKIHKGEFAMNPIYFAKGKITSDTKIELSFTTN